MDLKTQSVSERELDHCFHRRKRSSSSRAMRPLIERESHNVTNVRIWKRLPNPLICDVPGVSVHREAEREFSNGDRVRIAPS
jgi:hypothetical protein